MIERYLLGLPEHIKKKALDSISANQFIADALIRGQPCFVSRFGSVEGQIICQVLLQGRDDLDSNLISKARKNAGIIPADKITIRAFSVETMSAAFKADLLAIWDFPGQVELANYVAPKNFTGLNSINPLYYFDKEDWCPWTKDLDRKRVLVIHPFVYSIGKQIKSFKNIKIIDKLWKESCEFILYRPAVTFAGENQELNWVHELARMKGEIAKLDFDVALIGAGAYGMPLGGFVKDIGRIAIHLGGATQLLFGIIGSRWERHVHYSKAIGEGWIRPSDSEIPKLHNAVDRSSYW